MRDLWGANYMVNYDDYKLNIVVLSEHQIHQLSVNHMVNYSDKEVKYS